MASILSFAAKEQIVSTRLLVDYGFRVITKCFVYTALTYNLFHLRHCILINWHVIVHLHAQASPLDCFFNNFECQE